MAIDDFFLEKDSGTYSFAATTGNEVTVFDDNALYYASILKDLRSATEPEHFIYFAGWWTDLDIPLGDPKTQPSPPTFKQTLIELAKGKQTTTSPVPLEGSAGLPPNNPGPEVRCIAWLHKLQADLKALAAIALVSSVARLPDSLYGGVVLLSINFNTVISIKSLDKHSNAILDDATRLFGTHHQKFIVILNESGLVAYVGSSDFNADRLYQKGDKTAANPPTTAGAPLNDVNIRVVGPAAADLLTTFVDRWDSHSAGQYPPLKGAGVVPSNASARGSVTMQVAHTYGLGYPFPKAVRTAAAAQLQLLKTASQYVYYEDQYLIGNPEIAPVLQDKLSTNKNFVVIAVMAPGIIVGDLPWVSDSRSDFWRPFYSQFGPSENNRVLLFEMLNDSKSDNGPGSYLHNKMTIVDDEVATAGSMNFNQRSWSHDSELLVIFGGTGGSIPVDGYENDGVARRVRLMRWARHLGETPANIERFPDALARWRTLPSTSRVRPWAPSSSTRMDPLARKSYKTAYDSFIDPA